nr:glycosyltransferase [Methylococcales bacterium]
MKLTIVICTHNRSALLLKTLESIDRAIIPPQTDIAILVIPNACTDDTVEKLQEHQKWQRDNHLLPIQFVEEPKAGKSFALNKALTCITDGWICFIDDDQRVDVNYCKSILDAIINYPDTTLFCGKLIPDWTGLEPSWVHENGIYKIAPIPIPHYDLGDEQQILSEKNFIPSGGNLIIHQNVFAKTGNFSETLGPTGHNLVGSEDTDLILRALNVNEKLRYIPNIIQYHYVDPSRFKLIYLILMNFQRNRSFTLASCHESSQVPKYQWLKLVQYISGVLFCFNSRGIRFYLTKTAAILGQIFGIIQSKR